eukprot:tig00000190_g13834.t1
MNSGRARTRGTPAAIQVSDIDAQQYPQSPSYAVWPDPGPAALAPSADECSELERLAPRAAPTAAGDADLERTYADKSSHGAFAAGADGFRPAAGAAAKLRVAAFAEPEPEEGPTQRRQAENLPQLPPIVRAALRLLALQPPAKGGRLASPGHCLHVLLVLSLDVFTYAAASAASADAGSVKQSGAIPFIALLFVWPYLFGLHFCSARRLERAMAEAAAGGAVCRRRARLVTRVGLSGVVLFALAAGLTIVVAWWLSASSAYASRAATAGLLAGTSAAVLVSFSAAFVPLGLLVAECLLYREVVLDCARELSAEGPPGPRARAALARYAAASRLIDSAVAASQLFVSLEVLLIGGYVAFFLYAVLVDPDGGWDPVLLYAAPADLALAALLLGPMAAVSSACLDVRAAAGRLLLAPSPSSSSRSDPALEEARDFLRFFGAAPQGWRVLGAPVTPALLSRLAYLALSVGFLVVRTLFR